MIHLDSPPKDSLQSICNVSTTYQLVNCLFVEYLYVNC